MAIGNITNVLPASELPVMAEEELLANVTFLTVDGTGKVKQIPRPALFNTVATVVQKGDKGDTGATGLTGAKGDRGEKGEKGDKGDTGLTGATGAVGATGSQGFSGWTPVVSIVSRGSDEVLQVINWTNPNPSATNKPNFPAYIASTGLTSNISEAVNIKGSRGLQGLQGIQGASGANGTNGSNGWSPVITLREDVSTSLVYFYLNSWVGGTGASPITSGYISESGVTPTPVVGSNVGSLPLTIPFSDVTAKPTTLVGYGITDAYTKSEISSVGVSGNYEDLINAPTLINYSTAEGSPEGVITASIPYLYIDSATGNIYSKTTSTGNTGWKMVTLT